MTIRLDVWSGSNSGVECQLPKLDVAGSNPVSRSTFRSPNLNVPKFQLTIILSLTFKSYSLLPSGVLSLPSRLTIGATEMTRQAPTDKVTTNRQPSI